ncbi:MULTISPECIES: hypothetical protein [Bradyrhizobium]|uniref:HTH cro/C1-type domain-containing protein n=2 Tax=Bradyrhizobium TaxID=374 RepID=A0ABY0PG00_9BRAD|nr:MULTISPECIES: hypothetical protein [Bradyrhizobium]SDI27280.1 hypothetical protein SAMN05444163_2366 [Bradyrhizobium ottawaense]SED68285.1 hypothetical protein SAMN05444171_4800 [Bradyrhizobium lablabi]SHL64827.1 hypothetical protein SAMN05444321_3616 [Bradyrhizobium lablabi]
MHRFDQKQWLKTERIRAGFSSAKAAALFFGWKVGTYISHETGSRTADPDTAERYREAFQSVGYRAIAPDDRKAQAKRLFTARTFRGYRSGQEAITRFGWYRSTYYSHESGANQIDAKQAEIYAAAYDVSAIWLLNGTQPSGLGIAVDRKFAPPVAGVAQGMNYTPRPVPSSPSASSLTMLSLDGREAIVVRESSWSKDSLDPETPPPSGPIWAFDAELLKALWRADRAQLRVLVANDPRAGKLAIGDRLLVDLQDRRWRRGEVFVAIDRNGWLMLTESAHERIMARVLMRLGRLTSA